MNYLKQIFLTTCLITLLMGCSSVFAQTEFLEPEDPPVAISLGMYNTQQANFVYDDDKEKVKFVIKRDGILRLMSRDGQNDYLSFIGYESDAPTIYTVREIHCKNPSKTFYEINTEVGAHAKNNGYWLIGKHKGKWVTYVSLSNLSHGLYSTELAYHQH